MLLSPKNKENTERISTFLSPEVLEALKKEALSKGLTVSALMRMVLTEHTGIMVSLNDQGQRVVTRPAFVEIADGTWISNPDTKAEE